jgi:D-tyrosyl-tRNA(Tyr) deacylase
MRAVVQRVSQAGVTADSGPRTGIGPGLLVLLGVCKGDTESEAEWLAKKITGLRIFEDEAGKMNLSLGDIGGEMLIISQFTLYGDCRKGRRPGFDKAAPPDEAEKLYEYFISQVRSRGIPIRHGTFGAMMEVDLVNSGPVTLIINTPES